MPIRPNRPLNVTRRASSLLAALAAGLLACAALLLVAARSASASSHVHPYPGAAPCNTTLQACIDGVDDGDTIIISGTHAGSFTLARPISLTGVSSATAILQALPGQRVLTVATALVDSSVVISGLTFTGGNVSTTTTCPESCGGGVAIISSDSPLLSHLIISGNAAYRGGGLYSTGTLRLYSSIVAHNESGSHGGGAYALGAATVSGGLFMGNQCTAGACYGGGLYTENTLALTGTEFISNASSARGGGAYAHAAAMLNGGLFERNQCTFTGILCRGGGLFANATLVLTGSSFISNTSSGSGGGAYADGVATISGGLFMSNTAIGAGGGLFQADQCVATFCFPALINNSTLALTGTQFVSNSSIGLGDGGGVRAGGAATLNGGLFENNRCAFFTCLGGGLTSVGALTLTGTQFVSNASGRGGGLYAGGTFMLTDGSFISNTSGLGGGGAYAGGAAMLSGGLFQGNTCTHNACEGGGLRSGGNLSVTASRFLHNSAGGAGGGLHHANGSGSVINSLLAGNSAGSGAALYLASPGSTTLLHNTIAMPSGQLPAAAVVITNGVVGITNTLIANHATGIALLSGSARQDFNLFANVATSATGGVASNNSSHGSAAFVNPAAGDYRIGTGSDAIDTGTDAGVQHDFFGTERPIGDEPDIGFHETWVAGLSISKTANTALAAAGDVLNYTIVVSNAGPHTATGVLVSDTIPAGLTGATWTCGGAGGATCPADGAGSIAAPVTVTAGGFVQFTLAAVIADGALTTITNTATLTPPPGLFDTNTADNSASAAVQVEAPVVVYRLYLPAIVR